jgi:hypothetical protein
MELPPASNAAPLFREKLEALVQAADELKYRKEKLQGGRFVPSSMYKEAPTYLKREDVSDEHCARGYLTRSPQRAAWSNF